MDNKSSILQIILNYPNIHEILFRLPATIAESSGEKSHSSCFR